MDTFTSEAYDAAAYGVHLPHYDDDGYVDPDDDGEDGFGPEDRDWRPSPACAWSPAVKGLFYRLRETVGELLNCVYGALDERTVTFATVMREVVDRGYLRLVPTPTPFSSRRERIAAMGLLTAPGEAKAVHDEVERTWALLRAELAGATPDMPPEAFARIDHRRRDFRILAALYGLHPNRIWGEWEVLLGRLDRAPELKAFFSARDGMRAKHPEIFLPLARKRDAKRRGARSRQEYQAAYQPAYRALPESLAADAARKKADRAAMTPEERKAESDRRKERRQKAKARAVDEAAG